MKAFLVLSMVIATAVGLPNSYGYGQVRIETTAAPIVRRYEAPAPIVRTTAAPVYEAPAVKVAPSYGAYGEVKSEVRVAPTHIPIVRHNMDSDHQGKYSLDVETGHGILHTEQGQLKDLNLKEGPVGVKSGSYSYTGPDGKKYTVNWTADENGFHATGDHLPTSPPIPEAIQKSLLLPRVPEHLLDGPKGEGEVLSAGAASYGSSYSAPAYSAPAAPIVLPTLAPVRVSSGY